MTVHKRNMITACAVLLVAVMTLGSTLAFFTDTETKTNVFTMGNLDITLAETWTPADGEKMVPGDTVVKAPKVTAVKGDGYMRVTVTILDKNTGVAPGTKVTDAARIAKIKETLYHDANGAIIVPGTKYSTADIAKWNVGDVKKVYNDSAFTETVKAPGVFVYTYKNTTTKNIFKEGMDATLLTNVVIPSDWNLKDIELLGKYDIEIKAEAIQAEGFANDVEAFAALDAQIAKP